MKKHTWLYALICIVPKLAITADAQQDPFEQLNKRAEKQYQTSSDQATSTTGEKVIQKDMHDATPCPAEPSLTLQDALRMKELLFTVQQPWVWSFERLSCKRLLKKNPQWQRIKDEMSQEDKNQLLSRMADGLLQRDAAEEERTKIAFRIACAVCAGADPNTRTNSASIEYQRTAHNPTILQLSCADDIPSLFNFLVRHGADPDLICHHDVHPYTGRDCAQKRKWSVPKQFNSSQEK